MRVGVVTGSLSRKAGGLYTSVRESARFVQERGAEVCVVGYRDKYTEIDSGPWKGVKRKVVDCRWFLGLHFGRDVSLVLDAIRSDIIHAHGIWLRYSRDVWAYSMKWSIPYMVSPRGMVDPWAMAQSRFKKAILWQLYQKRSLEDAACLHALCKKEAKSMRKIGLRNPICVIPNGVSLDRKSENVGGGKMRFPDRFGNGKRVLLFMARLHPKKGVLELLEAWGRVCRSGIAHIKEWCLVIAGPDETLKRDELESLASRLGCADNVFFPGEIVGDRKNAWLAFSEAFILPSFSEGMPMAVLEAWSYGKPVLLTRACNLPEGEAAGAAVMIDSPKEDLVDGLISLMSMSDSERRAMGARGAALVRERFSWERVARDYLRVYRALLARAPIPEDLVYHG